MWTKRRALESCTLILALLFGLTETVDAMTKPVFVAQDGFDGGAAYRDKVAFLVTGDLEVRESAVPFVFDAFSGHIDKGRIALKELLPGLLSGATQFTTSVGYGTPVASLRDLQAEIPDTPWADHVTIVSDAHGVRTVEVAEPEALAAQLREHGFDYLLVLSGLHLTVERRAAAEFVHEFERTTLSSFSVARLAGQVSLWHAPSQQLHLHGFVDGERRFEKQFRRETAKHMTKAFVERLHQMWD